MAVYTPVAKAELSRWLEPYALGELLELEGIAGGIENSNFFVRTGAGDFVLTLFERLPEEQLPYYLELMQHLALKGVPCPRPAISSAGRLYSELNGKPATLVTRLHGTSRDDPGIEECVEMARAMAFMHLAAQDFTLTQQNPRGIEWWQGAAQLVSPHLEVALADMLDDELTQVSREYQAMRVSLPGAAIHADLFRDNVLFHGTKLSGFIDFYFAGQDTLIFDLAVAVNDWCIVQPTGELNAELEQAFLRAYAEVRPFTIEESQAWPWALRAAALRFWLSRLADLVLPRKASMLTPHDPKHFERIVMRRRLEASHPIVELPL